MNDFDRGQIIEITTPIPIAPGNTGILTYKMQKTAALIDVKAEEGVVIQRVMAGRDEITVTENQSWSDVLGKQIKVGFFITIIALNNTDEAKVLNGAIVLDYITADSSKNSVSNNNVDRGTPQLGQAPKAPERNPNNYGRARVINMKPTIQTPKVIDTIKGKPVNQPIMGKPIMPNNSNVKPVPENVIEHRDLSEDVNLVLPNEGEKAVQLMTGHINGLLNNLKFNAPLRKMFLPTMTRQLQEALYRGNEAVAISQNETVVCLTNEQILALAQYINKGRGPFSDKEKAPIILALEKGLNHVSKKEQDSATAMVAQV